MAKTALAQLGTSIFSEMTRLANEKGAVNLSQGFPDFEGPTLVVDAAVDALRSGQNQYGRSMGLPALVEAIAAHQQGCYGLSYDPMSEVCACAGATEVLAAAMIGLLDPGDEVILLEPFYDGYPATIAMAGASQKIVTLKFPDFAVDAAALAAAVTSKTRMIVVNTPHNPTGKVFSASELDLIAALCVNNDLIALTDEVYEHLVYDDAKHVPLAARPGMRERTVTVSSTGKTFSFTGWKVGWCTGPKHLVADVQRAHQFLTFCAATPLHAAMAKALTQLQAPFFHELAREYQARRDFLSAVLVDVGFDVATPKGAYFVLASSKNLTDKDDVAFARELIDDAGVAAIPPSAFYAQDVEEGRRLLRFAFCKKPATLETAAQRMREWRRRR
ncbi:MAG TPA: aminotransferase class I/II-fold pyridoxal phosphate-dependent enzyme [Myxococcota bacterium]